VSAEDTRPGIPAPLDDGECDRLGAPIAERAVETVVVVPGIASLVPVPAEPPAAATEPARGSWRELRAGVPLPPGALAAAKALRYGEPVDTYTWDYVAEAALLAAAPLIRAEAEALLAALRSLCGEGAPAVAVDRIEAILGTQERTDEEAPVLSASCTGCGDQFADSETGEYEFATRDRMERLLYADGWSADPVRCPACQPEPSPAGQEAAGQIPLPGVA
jgi:hypothetical protein